MREALIHFVKRRLQRFRGKKPLLSVKQDITLLRNVHKRGFPNWKQLRHIKKILSRREYDIFRFSMAVFGVGVLWSVIILINTQRTVIPAVGGKHIEAVVGTLQKINPVFSSINDVDQDIVRLVYSGLMRYNKDQRLIPDLAVGYEISDDKKIYTFVLREDVFWHDGKKFTANDIVFTIDTIQNSLTNSPLRVSFEGVKVEAPDDTHVVFTLSEPYQPFLSTLTLGILPEHVWINIPPERLGLAQQNMQPIGTGPYMFKKFAKDVTGFIYSYELARFEKYYDQSPFIQEFVFRFFNDYEGTNGAIVALREEKVTALSYVPYDLRNKVERKYIDLRTLHLPQYTALFLNQKHASILENAAVREALTISLDKERIIRQSLGGEAQIINGPLLPDIPGYTTELKAPEFSITKANELLDKKWPRIDAVEYRELRKAELLKEYKDQFISPKPSEETPSQDNTDENSDSEEVATSTDQSALDNHVENLLKQELNDAQTFYRKDGDSKILELNIVTTDRDEYKKASQLIAGYWQEIGIKTTARFVSSKDISRDVLKPRDYDVLLYGLIVGENPDQYPFWHSSQIDFPGLNLSRYINRKLDDILVKVRETDNEQDLEKLYTQFQNTLLEDRPAIFLYTPIYTYALLDSVQGTLVEKIYKPSDRFSDVTSWYIKTKKEWKKN